MPTIMPLSVLLVNLTFETPFTGLFLDEIWICLHSNKRKEADYNRTGQLRRMFLNDLDLHFGSKVDLVFIVGLNDDPASV